MALTKIENQARHTSGRFGAGNQFGRLPRRKRGEKRRNRLSQAIAETVTSEDLREVMRVLVEKAKTGNVLACREVLARALGRLPSSAAVPTSPSEPADTDYNGEWAARYIAQLNRKKAAALGR
jgi:hypothetical protein